MIRGVEKVFGYLLLAPALLPLLYLNGFLYPYVAPKTFLLRGLGIVLAAAFVFLVLSRREFYWERLRARVTWIPAALLLVAYLTSTLGVDFYHSFWSIYDRGDGLLTLTVIALYFYAILLFADRDFLERLMRLVAWTASFVALYVVLQWLQSVSGFDIPLIEDPRGRFGGTLGNAAFLAAYLGMTFFVTLIAAPTLRGKWRTIMYASAALQVCAILISATRGTLLALLAAAFVALVYGALKGGRARAYARAALVAGIIAAGLFFAFRAPLAQVPFAPIQRLASISFTETTVSSRLFVWQNIGAEALSRPFTGFGAEHIDVLFNKVYDPTGIQEQWFDRSHNTYLDYFVQFGVFGLALYLAFITAFAYAALRCMRDDARTGGLLVLLVVTYALQNFFVFDTAATLWLLLALFAALLTRESAAKESALPVRRVPWLPEAVGVAMLLLLIPVSIQPARANLLLADAYYYHVADVRTSVALLHKGLSVGTYADLEYGYQVYEMYTSEQQSMLTGESRVIAFRFAADTLEKNFNRYPYDARTAAYYALVLDAAPPEVLVHEDELREVIDHAISLSPKRAQPYYLRANILLRKADAMKQGAARTGLYRDAIGEMERYVAIVPKLSEPYYVIASIYLVLGEKEKSQTWADKGLALYTSDFEVARRAARYYIQIEDWRNAARFLGEIAQAKKEDAAVEYDYAKALWLAGDKAGAREIVERIKAESPELYASDPNFVKEYTAGE
ncbi:hypothetical protein A3A38_02265 [Candidatus Kaiserbacteria bacterium RIFCSPLOWO2_01_FULL_53_17]|uniref:O-antigen ligase-related domain-containing protein n=1 Tax=Candidatus Kaiserbacteria bacterium RIFCSPLOWO2_01_FULL_53_17 TaxID=1798511 RepID=A0A1F6EFW7_9BACT|nr:MAG: hypothetical protein A3A38_02265 [Candidatus Kaiserbacteria bacterium RIFCSPLOWO2_01_FULL_53_17]